MIARNPSFHARPAGLPDGVLWCPTHATHGLRSLRWACPGCASPASMPQGRVGAKRPRSGGVTEALLCAVLDRCGLIDAFNASATTPAEVVYVREFAWGIYLPEPRLFRFDAAVPARRLAFEVDGGAHAAGRAKVKSDTERRGLAASNGWRVVALTTEQVNDGSAEPIVRRALAFGKGA